MIAGALTVPIGPAEAAIGPATVISNGTVSIGVQPEGNLIVGDVGITFVPTGNDSLAPGCPCEGWGVADAGSGVTGFASESNGQGNVVVTDFTTTATTASSVVSVPGGEGKPSFEVTHAYAPATETSSLYRVSVSVRNASTTAVTDLRYRRVMDWDTEPTAFNEFVTNQSGTAADLKRMSNDGFETPNPLKANTASDNTVAFFRAGPTVDYGPNDHGALFDFEFGPLAAGATKNFVIFYGAAADQSGAIAALAAVGAEAYSLGQPNNVGAPRLTGTTAPSSGSSEVVDGTPNTFIFAFGGIGGAPIFTSEPAACAEKAPVPAGYKLITGTPGDDTLNGSAGSDLIRGLGGNDTINGLSSKDILCGGDGNDRVDTGSGNDEASGGAGNDTVIGTSGNDVLYGGAGTDRLDGGSGTDRGIDSDADTTRVSIESNS